MNRRYTRFMNDIARDREESLLRLTFNEQSEFSDMIKMAGGLPSPRMFPLREGSFTLEDGRRITLNQTLMEEALQYGSSDGYAPLLKQIQSLTQRLHKPPCWPDTAMFVTAGSQSGLCLAMEAMISKGDYVIIEEPCYSGALAIMNPYKPCYLSVEADAEGMKPESLRSALSCWRPEKAREATHGVPKFLYTNPNGCNPTGGITTTERRKEIYKIASDYNIIILEDDPYYFIQFRDQKEFPPSYLSMDTDNRVIRFDSFAKTLSAGLRVGYVTGPLPLVQKMNYHQQCSVSHASMLSQVIISEILRMMGEDGYLEHVQKVKEFYKSQRDAMLASATKYLSGLCQWDVPAGGMFLWVKGLRESRGTSQAEWPGFHSLIKSLEATTLQNGHLSIWGTKRPRFNRLGLFQRCQQVLGVSDTVSITQKLKKTKQVLVVPGAGFLPGEKTPSPYLRISFSITTTQEMDEGCRRLAEFLKEELQ